MKRLIGRLSRVADSSGCNQTRKTVVAEGHVPVHVGEEMERFEVRADLLSRPAFAELLRRSALEYGYNQRGVLRIPCPVPLFRRLIDSISDPAAVQELALSLPGVDGEDDEEKP
ncbi:Small auxin-up RNA protein [Dioscorea alata]|uniref:Small auxin-up RNA protein n=1 Tax=Dioscorea alata TaxID=55571 RepID=A0ACB7U2C4_DIOAL|nr:Small auxin-up RNA protein [Dioscorea alata]